MIPRGFLFGLLLMSRLFPVAGQCPVGQNQVAITIQPDNAGHETTWVLKNSVTQAVIGSGGPYSTGVTTPVTTNLCVDSTSNVTFVITDSERNGLCCMQGSGFYYIIINGDTIRKNGSFTHKDSLCFLVPPVGRDASILSSTLPKFVDQSPKTIKGVLYNLGSTTMNSARINYQVNGGLVVNQIVSSMNLPKFKPFSFTFSTPWVPGGVGDFTVKIWTSEINASTDLNNYNDTLTLNIFASDHLSPRHILVEAFTSCTDASGVFPETLLDSLLGDNPTTLIPLKYHVGFPAPGNDPMYLADSSQINSRKNFYSIPNTLPRAIMDGFHYKGPAFGISQDMVNELVAKRSIFDITLNESISGNVVTMDILTEALAPLPNGNIKVFAVVTEDPVSYVVPPGASGQMTFSHVVRQILPDVNGGNIGAPIYEQPNSFSFSYTIGTTVADPSRLRTSVFIQDMTTGEIFQSLKGDTITGYNHSSTIDGIGEFSNEKSGHLRIFPNPSSNGNVWVVSPTQPDGTGHITVSDISGRLIFSVPVSNLIVENRAFMIHLPELPPGLYLGRLSQKDRNFASKLIILK